MPLDIPNTHLLIVRTLPATNDKPVKITIKSELYRTFKSISRGANNTALDDAIAYVKKQGFEVLATAEGKGCNYLITSTFRAI